MGTPEYAKEILEGLINLDEFDILLVLTQPDKPVGRKKILTPPPVKVLALDNSIEVIQPKSLREAEVKSKIEELKPDFIVVAAYGQILPKSILDIAPCINLHASLLPKYRGASPIQQSILEGDKFSGVSAMLMEEGLDSGPILALSYLKITDSMKLDELGNRLTKIARDLTPKVLKRFSELLPLKQLGATSSHCKKIKKGDGRVDFSDAKSLYQKFKAFYGWPGIFLDSGLKLIELELIDKDKAYKEGEILDIEDEALVVGCKVGAVRLITLQPPGKRAMSAKAYIVGRGLKRGDTLL